MKSFCNNCGKVGHPFHQCKSSIISLGILLFRKVNDEIQYLLIKRKDTLGYTDFIRGKYPLHNIYYLKNLFNEMTNKEKMNIKKNDFDTLWNNIWGTNASLYPSDEKNSKKKFEILKEGFFQSNEKVDLVSIIGESTQNWEEPEWGFPKGKRNYQEKDIECAIREFEEETGYDPDLIHILYNVIPFEEIFIGSNLKSYKHKYFLAYIDEKNTKNMNNFQKTEVSDMKWCNFEEAWNLIRPYNLERKLILKKMNEIVKNYHICFNDCSE